VTPEMSPDANLLVFYSRPDGEVVSDAVKLTVNPCFQNKVSVSWDREEGAVKEAIQEFFLKREAVDIRYHQDGSSYDSTFKPGIPTQHEVLVKHTITEQPVEGEEIQVCPSYGLRNTHGLEMGCRNLTSDQEGKVRFTLPPLGPDVNGVYFSMKSLTQASVTYPGSSYTLMHQPSGGHSLRPSASPSNSALEIISNKAKVDCGEEFQLNFVFIDQTEGERDTDFTVQLSSRGNILFSRKVTEAEANPEIYSSPDEPTWPGNYSLPDGFVLRKLSTSFPVTPEMSPDANLLVFYSRPDGEVVSDAVKLTVNPCFQNKVSVSWDREEGAVKEEATLTARASPASTCGLRVVDESLLLLRPGNRITPDTISKYLQRFVPNRWEAHRPWEYCISIPENDTREVPEFHAEDAREAFEVSDCLERPFYEDSALATLTDLSVATRLCRRRLFVNVLGRAPPMAAPNAVSRKGVPQSARAGAGAGGPSSVVVNTVREVFPETFLFELSEMDQQESKTAPRRRRVGQERCAGTKLSLSPRQDTATSVLTDLDISTRLCRHFLFDARIRLKSPGSIDVHQEAARPPLALAVKAGTPFVSSSVNTQRDFFPETFLFQIEQLNRHSGSVATTHTSVEMDDLYRFQFQPMLIPCPKKKFCMKPWHIRDLLLRHLLLHRSTLEETSSPKPSSLTSSPWTKSDVTATILTDLDVATRICRYSPHFGGDIRPVSLAVSGDSFPQEEVQHDAVAVAFSGFAAASPPSPPPVNTRRDFFPETFLFDVVPLDDIGEATVSRSLPDTITTWVADAVCISPEDGIGEC
ncbi:unnamed protein product, partial [Cyprideis torosa]